MRNAHNIKVSLKRCKIVCLLIILLKKVHKGLEEYIIK